MERCLGLEGPQTTRSSGSAGVTATGCGECIELLQRRLESTHGHQTDSRDTLHPPPPGRGRELDRQPAIVEQHRIPLRIGELAVRNGGFRQWNVAPDVVVGAPNVRQIEGLTAPDVAVDTARFTSCRLTGHRRHLGGRRTRAHLVTLQARPLEACDLLLLHTHVRSVTGRAGHRRRAPETGRERQPLELPHKTKVVAGTRRDEHWHLAGQRQISSQAAA